MVAPGGCITSRGAVMLFFACMCLIGLMFEMAGNIAS